MRHIKLLGLAMLACLACLAVVTSAASAVELPTLLPEPTAKAPLTFTGKSVGTTKLVTAKSTVECQNVTATEGKFEKEENNLNIENELLFKGCKNGTAKCSTAGAEPEEIKTKAKVTLVTLKEGSTLRGGALVEVAQFTFKCGVVADEVKGGALGKFEKSKGVALASLEKVKTPVLVFTAAKTAEQTFLKCESPKLDCEKEHTLEANFGGGFEKAAQEGTLEVSLNKEIEAHF